MFSENTNIGYVRSEHWSIDLLMTPLYIRNAKPDVFMRKQIVVELISFLFILLFVYAAINKLTDYQKFVVQLGQSPLLMGLAPYVAVLVIGIELVIPILLSFAATRLAGFYVSFSLMVMFTAYIAIILNFSSFIPCSCGGILETLGWHEHLVFNTFFVLLALCGIILESKTENQQTNIMQP